ncbi:MAG: RNA 2',3'-cyclic phosphodiesterase [Candidatus Omnitrophota bacterium]|jgi:2'-5' RNA ligase
MQKDKAVRSFIALELPKNMREACRQIESELKPNLPQLKWVAPQNIHLTLKFLGQITPHDVSRFIDIIKNAFANLNAFSLQIKKPGFFPNKKNPRIIFLAINQKKAIQEIYARLDKVSAPNRDSRGLPFEPHITLARIKDNKLLNTDISLIEKVNLPGKKFLVNRICLFESKLTAGGPQYKKLFSLTLP